MATKWTRDNEQWIMDNGDNTNITSMNDNHCESGNMLFMKLKSNKPK